MGSYSESPPCRAFESHPYHARTDERADEVKQVRDTSADALGRRAKGKEGTGKHARCSMEW